MISINKALQAQYCPMSSISFDQLEPENIIPQVVQRDVGSFAKLMTNLKPFSRLFLKNLSPRFPSFP